jgi:hypothetical protein
MCCLEEGSQNRGKILCRFLFSGHPKEALVFAKTSLLGCLAGPGRRKPSVRSKAFDRHLITET